MHYLCRLHIGKDFIFKVFNNFPKLWNQHRFFLILESLRFAWCKRHLIEELVTLSYCIYAQWTLDNKFWIHITVFADRIVLLEGFCFIHLPIFYNIVVGEKSVLLQIVANRVSTKMHFYIFGKAKLIKKISFHKYFLSQKYL